MKNYFNILLITACAIAAIPANAMQYKGRHFTKQELVEMGFASVEEAVEALRGDEASDVVIAEALTDIDEDEGIADAAIVSEKITDWIKNNKYRLTGLALIGAGAVYAYKNPEKVIHLANTAVAHAAPVCEKTAQLATEAWNQVPAMPAIRVPQISMPTLSMPSMPTLHLPTIRMPQFSMPSMPKLSMPSIRMPQFSMPSWFSGNTTA